MHTGRTWPHVVNVLLAGLLVVGSTSSASTGVTGRQSLPRFTEEREAAALFFVRKHLPELLPLLDQLRRVSTIEYHMEIREIFQETELLADLTDEPKRYELELRIWKTENRAHALVGKLSSASEDEHKKTEERLRELARELVDLDVQLAELKAEELERDLIDIKVELAKLRENHEKLVKDRFQALLEKARKHRKP